MKDRDDGSYRGRGETAWMGRTDEGILRVWSHEGVEGVMRPCDESLEAVRACLRGDFCEDRTQESR